MSIPLSRFFAASEHNLSRLSCCLSMAQQGPWVQPGLDVVLCGKKLVPKVVMCLIGKDSEDLVVWRVVW